MVRAIARQLYLLTMEGIKFDQSTSSWRRDQTYIDNSVPIFPYSKVGEPNTMFNPVPIKAAYQISAHKPTKEELTSSAKMSNEEGHAQPQPLTKEGCKTAGMKWNDQSNVCG